VKVLPTKTVSPALLIALTFLCLLAFTDSGRAQRAIPDDNLAYPVLITVPGELASGFFLNTETSVYLVTAKHVIFDPINGHLRNGPIRLLSYARTLRIQARIPSSLILQLFLRRAKSRVTRLRT
jgi:hypothetical protein